jgi:spore coat protein CotF
MSRIVLPSSSLEDYYQLTKQISYNPSLTNVSSLEMGNPNIKQFLYKQLQFVGFKVEIWDLEVSKNQEKPL